MILCLTVCHCVCLGFHSGSFSNMLHSRSSCGVRSSTFPHLQGCWTQSRLTCFYRNYCGVKLAQSNASGFCGGKRIFRGFCLERHTIISRTHQWTVDRMWEHTGQCLLLKLSRPPEAFFHLYKGTYHFPIGTPKRSLSILADLLYDQFCCLAAFTVQLVRLQIL